MRSRSCGRVSRSHDARVDVDWLIILSHFLATTLTAFGLDYDEALAVLDSIEDADQPPEQRAESMVDRAQIQAYRGDATAWPRIFAGGEGDGRGHRTPRSAGTSPSDTWVAIAEGRLADAARASTGIGGNWAPWRAIASAHAALRGHDLAAAREALASRSLQEELGAEFDILRSGLSAGVTGLAGRRDEAIRAYHETLHTARRIEHLGSVADLLVDAVFVLGPDDPETPAFAAEARAIYERAGARAYLDRLDEALRSAPPGPRATAPAADAVRLAHEG